MFGWLNMEKDEAKLVINYWRERKKRKKFFWQLYVAYTLPTAYLAIYPTWLKGTSGIW